MATFTVMMPTCCLDVVLLTIALVEVWVVLLELEADDFEPDWLDSVLVVDATVGPPASVKYPAVRTRMKIRITTPTPAIKRLRFIPQRT